MNSRGLVAISLFVGCIAFMNARFATANSFDWSNDPVISGSTVGVKVTAAPCHPVTVILYVEGQEVDRGTIDDVPGSCDLDVPGGSTGKSYRIEIECPSECDSHTGLIE
jgi:hypothetical protein